MNNIFKHCTGVLLAQYSANRIPRQAPYDRTVIYVFAITKTV